jgi:hypothetical protein
MTLSATQATALTAFLMTQDEIGLFTVSARQHPYQWIAGRLESRLRHELHPDDGGLRLLLGARHHLALPYHV